LRTPTKAPHPHTDLTKLTVSIVTAYLRGNHINGHGIKDAITAVFSTLTKIDMASRKLQSLKPAVPVAKSVLPDWIICLEDGRKLKMLKRHLKSSYGITPDEYRNKWGLPDDYPMVAPEYARVRSAFAKKIGLGRKTGHKKAK